MDIVHVTYEYPGVTSNCGGGGRVTCRLHDHLQRMGHRSHVVTDDSDGHWSTFPARSYRDIRRALDRHDPDIVHGHFSLPSSVALPRLVPNGTPLIITVMGADVWDPTRFATIRPLADRINRYILRAADAVVAPSRNMATIVRETLGHHPTHIPHGIDPDAWDWRARGRPATPTILTVARLVERKQLHAGIDAVARLRESGVDASYEIVGTGPLEDMLRSEAPDWTTVQGYVDDLQSVFDSADLFLLPSYHEAFGIAVCEALAAGLPCVVSDTGGQTDIVTSEVGAITAATPPALADGLRTVLNDYEMRQFATQGYVSEHFSASLMAKRYERVYRSLRCGMGGGEKQKVLIE